MRLLTTFCAILLLLLPWMQCTPAISLGSDAKTAVTKRQTGSCPWPLPLLLRAIRTPDCIQNVWNSYPSRCEELYYSLPLATTASQVRSFVNTLCTRECVDPVLRYPECFSLSRANVSLVTNGYCGKHNGEFCPVLLYLDLGVQLCNSIMTGCSDTFLASPVCTPSTCPNAWRSQADYYGCCFWGYLRAFGITTTPPKFTGCGGISFPQMCTSSIGAGGATLPSSLPVLLVLLVSVAAAALIAEP